MSFYTGPSISYKLDIFTEGFWKIGVRSPESFEIPLTVFGLSFHINIEIPELWLRNYQKITHSGAPTRVVIICLAHGQWSRKMSCRRLLGPLPLPHIIHEFSSIPCHGPPLNKRDRIPRVATFTTRDRMHLATSLVLACIIKIYQTPGQHCVGG